MKPRSQPARQTQRSISEPNGSASSPEEWLRDARQDLKPVAPMIEVDRRGVAYVEGTTTKVTEIVLNQRWSSQTPEELQVELPHLSVPQIDAALAYYRENKARCDAQIEAAEAFARQMKERSGESPLSSRLRRSGALR